jgi:hypothetical protein
LKLPGAANPAFIARQTPSPAHYLLPNGKMKALIRILILWVVLAVL